MVDQKKSHKAEAEVEPEKVEAVTVERPEQKINRYTWWSVGAGLIPVPAAATGVLIGVQLKMLKRLADFYGVAFSKNLGKSIVAALLGAITADSLRRGFLTKSIKAIPIVRLLAPLTTPVYSAAVTYATGKLFVQHFQSGGTLLDFDPGKVKNYFAELLKEGKTLAYELKNKRG